MAIRPIALSKITRDPKVAAFFARGERDAGPEPIGARPWCPDDLSGGVAERPDRHAAFDALSIHLGRGTRFLARELEDA